MAFSEKQLTVLRFPHSAYDAIICDGAVRSGKTSVMSLSFILWAMDRFDRCNFAFCGKSVGSVERNIMRPILSVRYLQEQFDLRYTRSDHALTVRRGQKENTFYLFGGKDESSYSLIQGITLAGVLLDETALMPRSFVEQALARCSVDGAKMWFNCNPENPSHWFYQEWILQPEKHNALHLHFLMDDNPSLSEATRKRYESSFSGVFYQRYILGEWVVAEGLVYPMFDNVVPTIERKYTQYYVSMDYGTQNPTAMLLWGLCDGVWYLIREYYHSGRETNEQKTVSQYHAELEKLCYGLPIKSLIIDPSATPFIAECYQRKKFKVWKANNDVLDGIQRTAQALQDRKILINDCCKRTIDEFGLYSWDPDAVEDRPIKENDHAMDAVRYFVNTVGIWKEKRPYQSILR